MGPLVAAPRCEQAASHGEQWEGGGGQRSRRASALGPSATGPLGPPQGLGAQHRGTTGPPQGFGAQHRGTRGPPHGFGAQHRGTTGLSQGFGAQHRGTTGPSQGFGAQHGSTTGPPHGFGAQHRGTTGLWAQHRGTTGPSQGFEAKHRGTTGPSQGLWAQHRGTTGPSQGFEAQHRGTTGPSQGFEAQHRGTTGPSQGLGAQHRGTTGPPQGFAAQRHVARPRTFLAFPVRASHSVSVQGFTTDARSSSPSVMAHAQASEAPRLSRLQVWEGRGEEQRAMGGEEWRSSRLWVGAACGVWACVPCVVLKRRRRAHASPPLVGMQEWGGEQQWAGTRGRRGGKGRAHRVRMPSASPFASPRPRMVKRRAESISVWLMSAQFSWYLCAQRGHGGRRATHVYACMAPCCGAACPPAGARREGLPAPQPQHAASGQARVLGAAGSLGQRGCACSSRQRQVVTHQGLSSSLLGHVTNTSRGGWGSASLPRPSSFRGMICGGAGGGQASGDARVCVCVYVCVFARACVCMCLKVIEMEVREGGRGGRCAATCTGRGLLEVREVWLSPRFHSHILCSASLLVQVQLWAFKITDNNFRTDRSAQGGMQRTSARSPFSCATECRFCATSRLMPASWPCAKMMGGGSALALAAAPTPPSAPASGAASTTGGGGSACGREQQQQQQQQRWA